MAMIPHGFFPRSAFDMDRWMQPMHRGPLSTLDMFDPFDELDHVIGRNMQWLNKPEFMTPMMPRVPQKYRITLDCAGYKPESIKTECNNRVLVVTGCETTKDAETGDFSTKEFKKTYTCPENAECDKMVSFMTAEGQLVIEMPLRETQLHPNMDLFPKIVDTPTGGKEMTLKFNVPEKIHPDHIHVSIKDRCLVVKAEDKVTKPDGVTKFHYYKKTTLPENTDFEKLKCNYDNHQISICAPLDLNWKPYQRVAIEHKPHWEKKCPLTYCTPSGEQKMVM
jgi:HSP20 family molecular chaperone IbpA